MNLTTYRNITILVFCVLLLTGCGAADATKPENGGSAQKPAYDERIARTEEGLITAEASADGVSMAIYAPVVTYPPENVYRVDLVKDEEEFQKLANELIVTQYPDYTQDGLDYIVVRDDHLVASFDCDNFFATDYIDVENDHKNERELDGDQLFQDYITEKIPEGSIYTPSDAVKIACDFINEHAKALDFSAYNARAIADDETHEGFYTIGVEGSYRGIPISGYSDPFKRSVGGSVFVGNSGIYAFQALFLLKESSAQNVAIVDAEQVTEALLNQFPLLIHHINDLQVDEISLKYFFQINDDGTYTLRPVWQFHATGQQDDVERRSELSFLYFAEDGSLCGVYWGKR